MKTAARSKCFVPECNNAVGVLFPKNPEVKKKWLKSLEIEDKKPTSNSFVCLDHFDEDGQSGALPRRIKPKEPSQSVSSKDDSKYISDREKIRQKAESAQIASALRKEVGKDNKQSNDEIRTYRSGKKSVLKNVDTAIKVKQSVEQTPKQKLIVKEPKISLVSQYKDSTNLCRLCMSSSASIMESIYNRIDNNLTILHVMSLCLFPLRVSKKDKLSKQICLKCLKTLKEFYKFRQDCLGMDDKQRELFALDPDYNSDDPYIDSDGSEEYLHVESLADYVDTNVKPKEAKTNGEILKSYLCKSDTSSRNDAGQDKSEIDKKFDKVEKELMKVLEGEEEHAVTESTQPDISRNDNQNQCETGQYQYEEVEQNSNENQLRYGEDAIYTENIIIDVINEDEPEPAITTDISSLKLPITIKPVQSESPKIRRPLKRKLEKNQEIQVTEEPRMTMIKMGEKDDDVVMLPSGIKVQVKEKFFSELGTYSSTVKKYLFHTEFLIAGGYLYEYRLVKYNTRYLHCALPQCPGQAVQTKKDNDTYRNEIEVIKAHYHKPPDQSERKKQMFFSIMRNKMQNDRNFNFKVLYEKMHFFDPEIENLVPLRKVIIEIAKYSPTTQVPVISSFAQFCDVIESDLFYKLHFAVDGPQFYQEKCEAENGARAIVFANPNVIKEYSFSKLMCVDASFHIESDDYYYQLVTVLVWVQDSYYPIIYAFVNQKSQEIYKKIFSFVYTTLAPSLRPEEIVTDYEANLYYALGETYVESSIGGSMFYYTQNLYKKICFLKLSRELELNSNFRSIYNMLIMLPLLPVNTIMDGLQNIQVQAKDLGLEEETRPLFEHVHKEWIQKVTPELFCVHRLENRINENIMAPFKKLRDLIMLSKGKTTRGPHVTISIVIVIEKLIELEIFLRKTFNSPLKKTFSRDLSSSQKKIVMRAWNYIENHPKININHFFQKVLGYIKCMENQLWIWGFYRYEGATNEDLINASNFSIVSNHVLEENAEDQDPSAMFEEEQYLEEVEEDVNKSNAEEGEEEGTTEEYTEGEVREQIIEHHSGEEQAAVVMEAVIDENGSFVLQNSTNTTSGTPLASNFYNNYVYK